MEQPRFIELTFVDVPAAARARLLWDAAPITCAAVLGCLPSAGEAHHAIYSGSECVHLLSQIPRIAPENATSDVRKGQVAFTWMSAGSAYGVDRDFAEICWFYDMDAQPRMWEGPVEVNIFAEIVGEAIEFYAVCRRMRREGVKPLRIEVAAG
jgi:hypothetical protein